MFEKKPEDPWELFGEIEERGEVWRAEHPDLPVALLFLSRIKRALAAMPKDSGGREVWGGLKAKGQSHARRRALFVAAEALGSLRRGTLAGEREAVRKALGVVVEEGTTLHKVRALRALSFIPSDECVPILKRGMQDRSPWVQATALNILLNMNLRQGAPRKVLKDFLSDRFRRQTEREEVLDPRAVVKNFHVNRGLFVALLKARGGKRLALLSLWLWVASALLGLLVALRAFAGWALEFLAAAALAVFVELPRLLFSTPARRRRTWNAVYRLFVWTPYKIVSAPVWSRHIVRSFGALRERHVYQALLDYLFVCLLVAAGLPQGVLKLGLALALYWVPLTVSSQIEDGRAAERFRLCMRCAYAGLLAWYGGRAGQDERLTLAFFLLAGLQGVWLLPLLWRGLCVVAVIAAGAAKDGVADLRAILRETVPGEAAPREPASLVVRLPRAVLVVMIPVLYWTAVLGEQLFVALWEALRPRLRKLAAWAAAVALLLLAAGYALSSLSGRFSDGPKKKLTGPELAALLVSLKPFLYFVAGGLALFLQCILLLAVVHFLWDELWVVERVRFRILSRNVKRFKSDNDFIAYVFRMVRDETLSTGLRVRAASALTQLPLASRAYVDQLTDLAEEDLPISVSDAVSKVAEDADKRLKRAQTEKFEVDMGLINRQLEGLWGPGEVLWPWIRRGLAALILPTLLVCAAWLYFFDAYRFTDAASLWCLVIGCALLVLYVLAAGREGRLAEWSLLYGLTLLACAYARPLQAPLYGASWGGFYESGMVGLVDLSALSSLIVPALVAGVVAQLGHTVYLLGGDVKVNLELEGKTNVFERRIKRLRQQRFVLSRVLAFALLALLLQSGPLQEYLDRRGERLPSFARNADASEVELRDIPTDGRVVHVAMVAYDEPAPGLGGVERTPSPDEARAAVRRSLTEGGLLPLEAEKVGGDVWLASEGGEVNSWWTSPARCLPQPEASANGATFKLKGLCNYQFKVRLVAVVYDRSRSDFIKGMWSPDLFGPPDPDAARTPDGWLLLDTGSPFVKAVWSPAF